MIGSPGLFAVAENEERGRCGDELVLQTRLVGIAELLKTPWIEGPWVRVVLLIVMRGDHGRDDDGVGWQVRSVGEVHRLHDFARRGAWTMRQISRGG